MGSVSDYSKASHNLFGGGGGLALNLLNNHIIFEVRAIKRSSVKQGISVIVTLYLERKCEDSTKWKHLN